MKKQLIVGILTILVCRNSFAQWTQTRFDDGAPAISAYADLVIGNSEDIFIYDKTFNLGFYLTSADGGKNWQRKYVTFLVTDKAKRSFCWNLNSVESTASGDLFMSLKYHPCYDPSKMSYESFRSTDNGGTWQQTQDGVSPSLMRWDTAGKNSTLGKEESLWYTYSVGNGALFAVSIKGYDYHQGEVYLYKTADNGINWNKTQVSVNNTPIKADIIPGIRFADAYKGTLFLPDRFLTTTNSGESWIENRYPLPDSSVLSADISSNGQDIYVSTGKDVFVFKTGASVAQSIYHTDDDYVYKVKLSNSHVNLLTRQGYFLKMPLSALVAHDIPGNDISLFPNPSVSDITLYSANSLTGDIVRIYDATGKLIEQGLGNGNSITVETKHLATGIYYAAVSNQSGQQVAVLKWIKE